MVPVCVPATPGVFLPVQSCTGNTVFLPVRQTCAHDLRTCDPCVATAACPRALAIGEKVEIGGCETSDSMTLHTLSKGHSSPLEELLLIRTQFAALKALAYRVQALEPAELSAQWDALHKSSRVQYEEMETTIRNFVSPGRWQPRFVAYYVLPIVLHVVKSIIFFSWIGLPGVLLYDVLVLLILGAARHPYAVSMTSPTAAISTPSLTWPRRRPYGFPLSACAWSRATSTVSCGATTCRGSTCSLCTLGHCTRTRYTRSAIKRTRCTGNGAGSTGARGMLPSH